MAKKNEETAVVSAGDYAVLQTDAKEIATIISDNVGPGGITEFDLDRIKVPPGGGRSWEITDEHGEIDTAPALEGVIVAWRDVRAYWSKGLDEGGGDSPPECSSVDAMTGVGTPGGDCVSCPLAEFGTSSRGSGRGQACRAMRTLFLLRPGELLPVVVVVPPSSLKFVRKTFLRLASRRQHFTSVVMRLKLEADKNADGIAFSRIAMQPILALTPDESTQMRAYGDSLAPTIEAQTRAITKDRAAGDETAEALAKAGEEMEKGTSKGTDDIPF